MIDHHLHFKAPHFNIPQALWKTCDITELKSIYDELASVVKWEDFIALFEYATQEDHGFLWVSDVTPYLLFLYVGNSRILSPK